MIKDMMREFRVTTDAAGPARQGVSQASMPSGKIRVIIAQTVASSARAGAVGEWLALCSEQTGAQIQVLPRYQYMPTLTGRDGRPVFLFELLEAIDGMVDYEALQGEFPQLTIQQIDSAVRFLRKLVQYNAAGLDVDELEDEHLRDNPALLDAIVQAAGNAEGLRVLDHH